MVSPLAVPFNPDMTEEERIALQEENNRKAAEFSEEFYSRLKVPVSMLPTGSGFRGVPQPVYQPFTPGFRSTSMFGDIPLITSGPLVTDYTDMSNYVPSYEEFSVYDVVTNTYVPDHGGREDDGFDPGSTIIGYEDSAGNPILDSSGKNWNDRDGFTQDDSVDASDSDGSFGGGGYSGGDEASTDDSGDWDGDEAWSHGGTIPPVYAQTGYSQEDLKKQLEAMQAAKVKQSQSTINTVKENLGIADSSPISNRIEAIPTKQERDQIALAQAAAAAKKQEEEEAVSSGKITSDTVSTFANVAAYLTGAGPFADLAKVYSALNMAEDFRTTGSIVPSFVQEKVIDPLYDLGFRSPPSENGPPTPPKGYYGDDMNDPATDVALPTSYGPAFDPSPGTINPMTGELRRPEDDIILGGTLPDVNLSLTKSGGLDVPTTLPKSLVDVYNASQSGNYPTTTGLAPISSGPMVDSYTNIDAIQAYKEEFAAAQEAKRQAAIQAVQDQIAAAIAVNNSNSNYNDTSPGDDDWDERTGAQAVKDAGGPDRTKGGLDSFYNKGGLVYAHEGTNLLGETKLNVDNNYLAFPQKPSVDPIPLSLSEFFKEKQEERLNARSDVGYEPGPREELGRGESDKRYSSFSDHPAFADESGRPMPTRNDNMYRPGGK